MCERHILRLFAAALLLLAAFQLATAQSSTKRFKTSSNITGSYTLRNSSAENSLDVQRLPGGKVKIYLYASWIGNASTGNVNTGEVKATVPLQNNVAVYESGACRITIRFTGRRAVVTQSGSSIPCDFGLNVSASGTYKKRNNRTPTFDF